MSNYKTEVEKTERLKINLEGVHTKYNEIIRGKYYNKKTLTDLIPYMKIIKQERDVRLQWWRFNNRPFNITKDAKYNLHKLMPQTGLGKNDTVFIFARDSRGDKYMWFPVILDGAVNVNDRRYPTAIWNSTTLKSNTRYPDSFSSNVYINVGRWGESSNTNETWKEFENGCSGVHGSTENTTHIDILIVKVG